MGRRIARSGRCLAIYRTNRNLFLSDMIRYRIAILDGFRAIAILTVIFFHFFPGGRLPLTALLYIPTGVNMIILDLATMALLFFLT